jgi:stress response protein YsnF
LASTAGLDVKKIESEMGAEPLVIPIIEQKTDTQTKSYTETVRIEKRLVERKKSIDINLSSEELFVNGKQVQPSFAETLKELKDKILDVVSFDEEKQAGSENIPGEKIPLFGEETEMEKTVPLYAEEVVVSKRFVKVADVIIRKRKVSQLEKVDIGTITEKLTIKNPSGREMPSFQEQG